MIECVENKPSLLAVLKMLHEEVTNSELKSAIKNVHNKLVKIKTCPATTKKRVKRKPSAYNMFIGSCTRGEVTGEKEGLRDCATKWKSVSGSEKEKYQKKADEKV